MKLFKTPYRLLVMSSVFGSFLMFLLVFMLFNVRPPINSEIIDSRVERKRDSGNYQILYLDRNIEKPLSQSSPLLSKSFVWQDSRVSDFKYAQNTISLRHGRQINEGDTLRFRTYPVSENSLWRILLKRTF